MERQAIKLKPVIVQGWEWLKTSALKSYQNTEDYSALDKPQLFYC